MATQVKRQHAPAAPELDRSAHVEVSIPVTTAPGAGAVHAAALPLAVEEDLGAVELYDEHRDWKDGYADAVGISRWREL